MTVQCMEHTGGISGVQLSVSCTLMNDIIHSRFLWERLVLDLAGVLFHLILFMSSLKSLWTVYSIMYRCRTFTDKVSATFRAYVCIVVCMLSRNIDTNGVS